MQSGHSVLRGRKKQNFATTRALTPSGSVLDLLHADQLQVTNGLVHVTRLRERREDLEELVVVLQACADFANDDRFHESHVADAEGLQLMSHRC